MDFAEDTAGAAGRTPAAATRDGSPRERWLPELFDNIPHGVIVADRTTNQFVLVNKAICTMLGYSAAEFADLSINDLHPPAELSRVAAAYGAMITGARNELRDVLVQRKDGAVFPVTINSAHFVLDEVDLIMGLFTDITELKRADAELRRQLAEKDMLLHETHHRIKNNIGSIAAMLTYQADTTADARVAAALHEAIGRIDSMRRLYDAMLIADAGDNIPSAPYPETIARSVVELCAGRTVVTLHTAFAESALDQKRLFALGLLTNELLTNALKYAFVDRDGGTVRVETTLTPTHIQLCVCDNGRGFDGTSAAATAGGFGLRLVRMVTEQHQGWFTVDAAAGTRCTAALRR